jgi:hypothetical protein
LKIVSSFYETNYHNEEVYCVEPSPSKVELVLPGLEIKEVIGIEIMFPLSSRHSSRSDRSDYDRGDYYRGTPSRETGRRRSSRDDDYHYTNSRVKDKRAVEKMGNFYSWN